MAKKWAVYLCALALLLNLTACSGGNDEKEKQQRNEAEASYEQQLEAQLGLLNEHITATDRQKALELLQEAGALKEERLEQGQYEKSDEEVELLQQLNEFYDSWTELYLVEEDQYYEDEPIPEAETLAEYGVGYELRTKNPDKKFYFAGKKPACLDMKRNTLENVCHVLKTGENAVEVSEEKRVKSLIPLDRMLEMAK